MYSFIKRISIMLNMFFICNQIFFFAFYYLILITFKIKPKTLITFWLKNDKQLM